MSEKEHTTTTTAYYAIISLIEQKYKSNRLTQSESSQKNKSRLRLAERSGIEVRVLFQHNIKHKASQPFCLAWPTITSNIEYHLPFLLHCIPSFPSSSLHITYPVHPRRLSVLCAFSVRYPFLLRREYYRATLLLLRVFFVVESSQSQSLSSLHKQFCTKHNFFYYAFRQLLTDSELTGSSYIVQTSEKLRTATTEITLHIGITLFTFFNTWYQSATRGIGAVLLLCVCKNYGPQFCQSYHQRDYDDNGLLMVSKKCVCVSLSLISCFYFSSLLKRCDVDEMIQRIFHSFVYLYIF